jgi:hypothetical protein
MAAFPNSGAAFALLIQPAATRCEDANGIPALLKNTYFSTLECIERSLLRGFRMAPSRSLAAAPTQNIENNPMQSSRRPLATGGVGRKLDTSGKSAAQFHHPGIR